MNTERAGEEEGTHSDHFSAADREGLLAGRQAGRPTVYGRWFCSSHEGRAAPRVSRPHHLFTWTPWCRPGRPRRDGGGDAK